MKSAFGQAAARGLTYSVVGAESQARAKDDAGMLSVGNHNEFHPFSVVSVASTGGCLTVIGNEVIVMQAAHVGHDCVVCSRAVLSNHAGLAGHVTIGEEAVVGAFAVIAQRLSIGDFAHVLPQSAVRRDVMAFETFGGSSDASRRINTKAVRRLRGRIADVVAIRRWHSGHTPQSANGLHERVWAAISGQH